jgi:hypothetical protein
MAAADLNHPGDTPSLLLYDGSSPSAHKGEVSRRPPVSTRQPRLWKRRWSMVVGEGVPMTLTSPRTVRSPIVHLRGQTSLLA